MISINTDEYKQKENREFYLGVIEGLTQVPKRLSSKYFYDKKGDSIFQAIMMSPDYYLTRCEMEIFTCQAKEMVDSLMVKKSDFELIELGPGNCVKSIHLLRALITANASFNYVPIDISENVICELRSFLPHNVPDLRFDGLTGDYFDTLASYCFLVCLSDMVVNLPGINISFQKDECIWTEISQKYSKSQIRQMAVNNGFNHTAEFLDSKSWFMDAIWTAI